MATAEQIAAYCTGAAGIITALGGLIVGVLGSRKAKEAAAAAVLPMARKIDDVGKQVGQHTYEMRDRLNTESVKADAVQRGVETLVAQAKPAPSEQSVWNYRREMRDSLSQVQISTARAEHALEQMQMLLGQTPTVRVRPPLEGPPPPPVPPLEDE